MAKLAYLHNGLYVNPDQVVSIIRIWQDDENPYIRDKPPGIYIMLTSGEEIALELDDSTKVLASRINNMYDGD